MPRAKKNARILNIKLDATVYDKLDQYCEKYGCNKTETVEAALGAYLDAAEGNKQNLNQEHRHQ